MASGCDSRHLTSKYLIPFILTWPNTFIFLCTDSVIDWAAQVAQSERICLPIQEMQEMDMLDTTELLSMHAH